MVKGTKCERKINTEVELKVLEVQSHGPLSPLPGLVISLDGFVCISLVIFQFSFCVFWVFFNILCTLQYIFNVRRAVQHTQHSWFKRVAQKILSGILLQQPRR
jgi:hypothetical protein